MKINWIVNKKYIIFFKNFFLFPYTAVACFGWSLFYYCGMFQIVLNLWLAKIDLSLPNYSQHFVYARVCVCVGIRIYTHIWMLFPSNVRCYHFTHKKWHLFRFRDLFAWIFNRALSAFLLSLSTTKGISGA